MHKYKEELNLLKKKEGISRKVRKKERGRGGKLEIRIEGVGREGNGMEERRRKGKGENKNNHLDQQTLIST